MPWMNLLQRIENYRQPKWPSVDHGTTRYVKMGNEWMKQADRSEP